MLEFKNVSFKYPEDDYVMMENLSFSVEDHAFISIIGASGCGKSTIFRLINGLEKPDAGEILVDGQPISGLKQYSAFMPQKDMLFPWRTIEKNLYLPMEMQHISKEEKKRRAEEVLAQVGLSEYMKKYPKDLSGGMKQRVAFARTLLSGAEMLLLDEPFSALDFQTRLAVCDDVWTILRREKKTAILVTHDLSEAVSMADRVLVLTKRPATICADICIQFKKENATPFERRSEPEFKDYFNEIWKELNLHG